MNLTKKIYDNGKTRMNYGVYVPNNYKDIPLLIYLHGDNDTLVPPVYSELCVNAVNANGGNAKLEILKGFGHNDGINYAYEHTVLIEWLISQRRSDFSKTPEFCSHLF